MKNYSNPLLEYCVEKQPEMLAALKVLVNHESPSSEKSLLDRLNQHLAEKFNKISAEIKIIRQEQFGNQLQVVFSPAAKKSPQEYSQKAALILCHFDTVWLAGTTKLRPFGIEADRAFGPGVLDMKGGIVITEFALRAIHDLSIELSRPVIVLLTSDEEIGSPSSRAIIEGLAQEAEYVLLPEPSLPNGVLKTARKGAGRFVVEIEGRAAHSGIEPEKGVSAITEMAHQILRVNQLADPQKGTTINVGVVKGGTKANVVAAGAFAEIDVRVWTKTEARRVENAIFLLKPVNPEAKVEIRGGFTRPPMERSEGIARLFGKAKIIAKEMTIDLQEAATGGASDGNFTAALGIPTLDGLGAVGAGAHSEREFVEISSLPQRAALLALLLLEL